MTKVMKSIDITLNPSWSDAGITEIYDEKEEETKEFSEKTINTSDYEFTGLKVKTFSAAGIDAPKSSKINGAFTKLKVKEFSSMGTVMEINELENTIEQKEFTQAEIKERLRETKMGPRMLLRRKYISYKQVVKSCGGVEKMKEEDVKILKSLFASDILNIMNSVTPQVVAGKQINTLLGLSALSKTARMCGQQLQQPLRMAMIEAKKQGFVTKMRYQKLQDAYMEFIKGLMEDVFGPNPEPIPEEDEVNEENK